MYVIKKKTNHKTKKATTKPLNSYLVSRVGCQVYFVRKVLDGNQCKSRGVFPAIAATAPWSSVP